MMTMQDFIPILYIIFIGAVAVGIVQIIPAVSQALSKRIKKKPKKEDPLLIPKHIMIGSVLKEVHYDWLNRGADYELNKSVNLFIKWFFSEKAMYGTAELNFTDYTLENTGVPLLKKEISNIYGKWCVSCAKTTSQKERDNVFEFCYFILNYNLQINPIFN